MKTDHLTIAAPVSRFRPFKKIIRALPLAVLRGLKVTITCDICLIGNPLSMAGSNIECTD